MKVIFLDLDGPLFNSEGVIIDNAVYCLGELVRLTEAKIVITSDWRIGKRLDQVRAKLSVHLGIISQKVIDLTDVIYHKDKEISRGAEIQSWLEEHESDIDNYVIIDDSETAALVSNQSHFVKVGDAGITGEVFREALRILG